MGKSTRIRMGKYYLTVGGLLVYITEESRQQHKVKGEVRIVFTGETTPDFPDAKFLMWGRRGQLLNKRTSPDAVATQQLAMFDLMREATDKEIQSAIEGTL